MKTFPLLMTGVEYVCEPSGTTHLMFFFAFTSHSVATFLASDTLFRDGVPPHCDQSLRAALFSTATGSAASAAAGDVCSRIPAANAASAAKAVTIQRDADLPSWVTSSS